MTDTTADAPTGIPVKAAKAQNVFETVAGDGEDTHAAVRKKEKFLRARQRKLQAREREKAQQEALKMFPIQQDGDSVNSAERSGKAPRQAQAASIRSPGVFYLLNVDQTSPHRCHVTYT